MVTLNKNSKIIVSIIRIYYYLEYYIGNSILPKIDFEIISPYIPKEQEHGKFITKWKIDDNYIDIKPDFDKFLDIILPTIIKDYVDEKQKKNESIPNPINIFIATHGAALKTYFNLKDRPKNTEMRLMECIARKQDNTHKIFRSTNSATNIYYNPESIRQTYKNFEILNPNICTDNSIKGLVNSKEIYTMFPIKDTITVGSKKYTLNDDLKNLDGDPLTDYKNKYLKYKSKYINLKKK